MSEWQPGDPFVYFLGVWSMLDGCVYVKIGSTVDVQRRLSTLRTPKCTTLRPTGIDPLDIELLTLTPGGLRLEREYQADFSHLRICGEWFVCDSTLLDCLFRIEDEVESDGVDAFVSFHPDWWDAVPSTVSEETQEVRR